MSNLPNGVTPRDINNLCKDGDTGASDFCCVCRRNIEYDVDRGFWRFDDGQFGEPANVVSVRHGEYVCSARCHSQYVYNNSTTHEREDMRLIAQMCETWLKVEFSLRSWSYWSYSNVFSGTDAGLLDVAVKRFLESCGMEDGENPPAWYVAATAPGPIAIPLAEPIRLVPRIVEAK